MVQHCKGIWFVYLPKKTRQPSSTVEATKTSLRSRRLYEKPWVIWRLRKGRSSCPSPVKRRCKRKRQMQHYGHSQKEASCFFCRPGNVQIKDEANLRPFWCLEAPWSPGLASFSTHSASGEQADCTASQGGARFWQKSFVLSITT